MTANIRYYSIAKDAYEAGDCPTCARCGSNMRHVTEINGQMYGSGCGKIVIEDMNRNVKMMNEVVRVLPSARQMIAHWSVEWINTRIQSCVATSKPELEAAWRKLLILKGAA